MTTLRREAKNKIADILDDYIPAEAIDPATERILDTLSELRGFSFLREDSMKNAGMEWLIVAGEEVKQEQIDQNVLAMNACNEFEAALNFNPLQWDLNKEWQRLKRFVIEQYEKDSGVFRKYAEWREGQGKFKGAMNNKNILDKPLRFIDLFPSFMASVVLSRPKSASISKDSNDAPMTY